ncbi:hypothetical protein [Celeribacter neptunius]|uniref:CVNH domain-containing protein n=1 Tax=Celeribacter neptunius TaxID=588602 RepID=A0A1I3X0G5_9RHOB|nr:hypothetical protein [Celeribacter neptunius]SFK13272.1 hypothetical protein SAMN04487991_3928 [Celeribacter neptunius]
MNSVTLLATSVFLALAASAATADATGCLQRQNLGKRVGTTEYRITNTCNYDVTAFWCSGGNPSDHWACGRGPFRNGLKFFVGTTILRPGESQTIATSGTSIAAGACGFPFYATNAEQHADVRNGKLVCSR